jgi:potassium-dependent mechanosensitive channel
VLLVLGLAWTLWSAGAVRAATEGSGPAAAAGIETRIETGAASVLTVPGRTEIEGRIKDAEADSGLEEGARNALVEQYRRTLTQLEAARTFEAKGSELLASLEQAPKETAEIRRLLELAQAGEPPEGELARDLGPEEIAQRLAKIKTETALLEARLAELDKLLEGSNTRLAQARARVLELKQALAQTSAEQEQPAPEGQSADLTRATAWALEARRQAQLAELGAIEQELASLPVREELYRARREQATAQLERLKRQRSALEAQQVESGKADAAQAREATEAAKREAAGKHPLVQEAADQNAEITTSLGGLAERLDGLNTMSTRLEQEQKRLEEEYRGAQQRVEVAGLNRALGQVLIDQRTQLPDLRQLRKAVAERDDEIAEMTLNQIRYREEQRRLRNLDQVLDELTSATPGTLPDQAREELKTLLEQRKTLLQKATAAQDTYLRKLDDINGAAQQLMQAAQEYDGFLAEHLLWVRSTLPVGLETLQALPAGVAWLLAPESWGEVLHVLAYALARAPLTWLGLLITVALLVRGAPIRRALRATAEPLRRIRTDHFGLTLKAIGLTLLAALPVPLLTFLLGRELAQSIETTTFTRAIGQGLMQVALGLYFLQAFRLTCMRGGLADRHFRWSSEVLTIIRRNLGWFIPLGVPLALLAIAVYQLNDPRHSGGLARVALTSAMIAVTILFARLLSPRTGAIKGILAENPEGWANRLRNLWFPSVVAIPLALGLLTLLGYSYAAGTMFQVLAETAWLALGLVLLHQTVIRWLMLTRRRLALQAALDRSAARRAQAEAERTEVQPKDSPLLGTVEEPEVDLASLDEQTRRLVNTLLGIAFALGIWWIWSDMLPALNLLDQIPLWHYQGMVGGTEQIVPVSAADVLMVLVIVLVALVAAKNLPALIEIILLQITSVTAGSRYAVKTLLSYSITAAAFLTAFGTLGLSWSQVQWLVAALSVGIGFGLQEIVANFISGLIILFERPVRVGDVVTIGDTTGVVTNIQIRATTIRNWDKQELLVPNKEFITGRLLNWTLTDQVNRITVNVGIEYGSDPELALKLLAEVAAHNPRVLKDPPPLVSFEAFGDNALMLVLRCYLDSLEYRMSVTTELHRAIDKVFAEHGIGIAFPQREIHVSAREPIAIRLRRG